MIWDTFQKKISFNYFQVTLDVIKAFDVTDINSFKSK